jgi:predicted RNA-binding Zn-ribbon protein involved in translation (DUF1610 family)
LVLAESGDSLWCQFCGAEHADPEAVQTHRQFLKAQKTPYKPPSRDWDMDESLSLALDEAWDCIQDQDYTSARLVLNHAQTRFPESADVWYLLSLTTEDRGQKLLYLENTLVAQPYHEYAWRDKGVIEGVIPAAHPSDTPDPAPDDPVKATSEIETCPQCGGALAFSTAAAALVCGHCGFQPGTTAASIAPRRGGYQKLENAQLQRRFGFTREWKIGARVLVCQNCAAQLTLGSDILSTQCPFCDSAHVLVTDAVGSFEEPDALVPFSIDREAAAKALDARLSPELRGEIERGDMQGVYLPFWAFAGLASINMPLTAPSAGSIRTGMYTTDDLLVAGVTQPSQAILYELMPYHLRRMAAYDPRFLARWPAQIYSVDVIQASITARAYLKYNARRQSMGYRPPEDVELARTDSKAYNPPDTAIWQIAQVEVGQVGYRLLLLPVWMITLITRDGARLPAVVNGQTGEAVLSASFSQRERLLVAPDRPPAEELPPVPPSRNAVIRPLGPIPPRSTVIRPLPPRRN